jgi:hypothetical protein
MPKYKFESHVTVPVYTIVEADNEDAAEEIASKRGVAEYFGANPNVEWEARCDVDDCEVDPDGFGYEVCECEPDADDDACSETVECEA